MPPRFPFPLPPALERMIANYHTVPDSVGLSSAKVYRLQSSGRNIFLKVHPPQPPGHNQAAQEAQLLRWLQGRYPVPEVLYYAEERDHSYLLMTALPGRNLEQAMQELDPETVVGIYAESLSALHRLPMDGCPTRLTNAQRVARARQALDDGIIDESNFEDDNLGMDPEVLFQRLVCLCPEEEDLVLTHGDYCPENIIVDGDGLSGCIDWGNGGIGDRYQDITLALRSLDHNYGSRALWPRFLSVYGLDRLDEAKLAFYLLLDEFF